MLGLVQFLVVIRKKIIGAKNYARLIFVKLAVTYVRLSERFQGSARLYGRRGVPGGRYVLLNSVLI